MSDAITVLESLCDSDIQTIYENVLYSDCEILSKKKAIEVSDYYQNGIIAEVSVDYQINGIAIVFDSMAISENEIIKYLDNLIPEWKNYRLIAAKPIQLTEEVSIGGGSAITVGTGGCSVGFAANKSGNAGFVTAAHCGSVGNNVYYNGTVIGTVISSVNQGNCDAMFIQTNSSVTVLKQGLGIAPFANASYLSAATVLPLQGSSMKVYGRYHTYQTTLTSNNASSGSWTGMLKYPKNTTNGDSGALIIIGNYAYGIHRGGGSYSIDYQNAFATPSSTVLSLLGLTN